MSKQDTLFELKPRSTKYECLVFHDESKKVFGNIWAHGVLFVPLSSYNKLVSKLWEIRKKYDCNRKLSFKDISGSKISKRDCSIVVKEWIEWGVEALKSKRSYFALACKLGVIFFPSNTNLDLYGGKSRNEKLLRYFEVLLRMLLKGCMHKLYNSENRIIIKGIITDGKPWHRSLDKTRIIEKMQKEGHLRDYVEIANDAYIEELLSNHNSKECKDKDKAQLLQLTDLLLGSVIHCCFRDVEYSSKKEVLIRPVREMLKKPEERKGGFRYSSHFMSFSLAYATPINGWEFKAVNIKDLIYKDNQLKLF